ncbi:MAG: tetratricopeptide repeat protein [Kiritimatiellae bacterium]|nr:tetratricopeptide repeat protein [Kiritimatiellia bacterium]
MKDWLNKWCCCILAIFCFSTAHAFTEEEWTKADSLFKKGSWSRARAILEKIAEETPSTQRHYTARYRTGYCLLRMKDVRGAMRFFSKLTQDASAARVAPADAGTAFEQSYAILLKQKKVPQRQKLVRQCAAFFPGHEVTANLCSQEGEWLVQNQKYAEALEFYSLPKIPLSPASGKIVCVVKDGILPRSTVAFEKFAGTIEEIGKEKTECAVALCDGFQAKSPSDRKISETKIRILLAAKEYSRAVAVMDVLMNSKNGLPEQYLLDKAETVGVLMNKPADAIPLYESWLKQYRGRPGNDKALFQYAALLWRVGKYEAATAQLDVLRREFPATAYRDRAEELEGRLLRDSASRKKAKKQHTQESASEKAIRNAERLIAQEEYGKALKILAPFRTQTADPQWWKASWLYGRCVRMEGDPKKAVTVWDEVIFRSAVLTNAIARERCQLAKADTLFEDFGEAERALKLYGEIPVTDGNCRDVVRGVVLAKLVLGRNEEAKRYLDDMSEKWEIPADDVQGLARAYRGGEEPFRFDEGKIRDAPASRVLFRAADLNFFSKNYERAGRLYAKLAKQAKLQDLEAYATMRRGECYYYLGKMGKVLPIFNLFLTRYRKTEWADEALLLAGCVAAGPLNDAKLSAKYLRHVMREYPKTDTAEVAWIYLATLAWWTEDWKEAERLHLEFLKLYPGSRFRQTVEDCRLPAIRAKSRRPLNAKTVVIE